MIWERLYPVYFGSLSINISWDHRILNISAMCFNHSSKTKLPWLKRIIAWQPQLKRKKYGTSLENLLSDWTPSQFRFSPNLSHSWRIICLLRWGPHLAQCDPPALVRPIVRRCCPFRILVAFIGLLCFLQCYWFNDATVVGCGFHHILSHIPLQSLPPQHQRCWTNE